MRAFTIFTLVFLAFILSCSRDENLDEFYYEQAQFYFQRENLQKASLFIDSAINETSRIDYQLLKAEIKMKQNLFFEPLLIYRGLLKNDYPKEKTYYLLGKYYFKFGQYLEQTSDSLGAIQVVYMNAIAYCDTALKLAPKNYDAYLITAISFHSLGNYEGAYNVADSALNVFPNDSNLSYILGVELYNLGDSALGLELINSVTKNIDEN